MTGYEISNINEVDSPALVVYPDRIRRNIRSLVESIDDVNRLRPHIKTHKSAEVSEMMIGQGIHKFKCATIAEAEMLADAGASDILLAYQPVGPKIYRLAKLKKRFPSVKWSCLIDDVGVARSVSALFQNEGLDINVFIDLNVGMNRTGVDPSGAEELIHQCEQLSAINVAGLHAYDGHLRDDNFDVRKKRCDDAFAPVRRIHDNHYAKTGKHLAIIAGGTPTFSIHRERRDVECSPGTFIYWDIGYEKILREQQYDHAALVVTRIVSKPANNIICTDLGHKAIASENPLPNRVTFLNAPDLEPIGHSEEHMVFKTADGTRYQIGDVLYGVPFHVCPTIALYNSTLTVQDGRVTGKWTTLARAREITI